MTKAAEKGGSEKRLAALHGMYNKTFVEIKKIMEFDNPNDPVT
jgi:hypothetical protein